MRNLPRSNDPALLVGPETSDDAGVYLLTDELALVESSDIITPLVDDPYTFGRIAAANALSDIYAMGGRPVTALNLLFVPKCLLSGDALRDILAGGASMLAEAGATLVGGHTVEDEELKYGLAVTGVIHPKQVVRNSTARPGDIVFLTKPLGIGIISTAVKAEMVDDEIVSEAVSWMTTLNDKGSKLMVECGASACTDVTGFGLIGHAVEMATGSDTTISIELESIPLMSGVKDLIRNGMVPAGCYRNRDYYSSRGVNCRGSMESDELLPLFDPQTSGGLLIALSPDCVAKFEAEAASAGLFAVRIGRFDKREGCSVKVL